MKRYSKPIQQKITRAILLTSTLVLLLTGFIYLSYEYIIFRENTVERMTVLAEVIGINSTAALAFDSQEEAYEILLSLRTQEHIVAAALFDENDALFTYFPIELNVTDLPDQLSPDGYYFENNFLEGYHPVVLRENRIGTLYLKYDLLVLSRQFRLFGMIAVGVFLLSLLLAYVLSSQLQKSISKPIVALADIADSISSRRDYSVRGIKQSDDEIGLLTDAFNQMLTQIETQNKALQESENRFRTLADNIAQLAWIADPTGKGIWYNKRFYKYTGKTWDEMKGLGWKLVHHPEHMERVVENFQHSLNMGFVWEDTFPLRDKNGQYRWFLSRAIPIRDEAGVIQQWFGTNTDISELREAEEALRLSEEFNRTLLESSPDCVVALDMQGRLLSMNEPGQKMFEIEDFTPYKGNLWTSLWPTEYWPEVNSAIGEATKGEIGHFQGISPTVRGTIKWWDVLIAPVRGSGNEVERMVAVSRDITKLKELEQQKDDFIGIASHELKTPVTSIKAYTQILQSRFSQSEDKLSIDMLAKMDTQLDKLTKLITDLLDVTRIDQGKLQFHSELFEFNVLVHDIVEDIQRTSSRHSFITDLSDNVAIKGDRDRIGQVITNFLTNAIKYSPKADRVIIRTVVRDEKLVFSVQDFGLGLSKEDQSKVFERFYRVGEPGRETFPGLGLGLYISAGIIERHKGRVWVDSTPGEGSTFFFSLPLSA